MAEKTDYSPVVEQAPEPEKRRQHRFARAFVLGAHSFWIYALALAGVVALAVWLAG